jgi:hypothetical protein
MWVAEFIAALASLALGLAVIFFSYDLPFESEFGPAAGFLPRLIGYGIAACAVIILINVIRKYGKKEAFFKPTTRLGVTVLIQIVIGFLLFPLLGFSVVLGAFTGVSMRTMGKHKWISCGITAVVSAIGIHYLFGSGLDIPLPTGLIGW